MQKLVDKLKSRVDIITKGGGEKAVSRHTSKGKYFMMWLNKELIRSNTETTNPVFTNFEVLESLFLLMYSVILTFFVYFDFNREFYLKVIQSQNNFILRLTDL